MPRRKKRNKEELLEDIRNTIGNKDLTDFREYQEEIINALLDGKDAFIVLPTGSGKSICFQYPAITKKGVTIVIEPTIALMEEQVGKLQKAGINAVYMRSVSKTDEEWEKLRQDTKIYYISPEKFLSPKFIIFAKSLDISMLVIDEAHCISMWGNGFRPQYLKIGKFFRQIGYRPQTVAFTATAGDFVKKQAMTVLSMKDDVFGISADDPERLYRRKNVSLEIKNIPDIMYKDHMKKIFSSASEDDPAVIDQNEIMRIKYKDKRKALISDILSVKAGVIIIYCMTTISVNFLYECLKKEEQLKDERFLVLSYHGRMGRKKKSRSLKHFMEKGKRRIMIATNAFGMGIDRGDVRKVINYETPKNIEDLFQEAGRAGRDGEHSIAVIYNYRPDIKDTENFIKNRNDVYEKKNDSYGDDMTISEALKKYELTDSKFILNIELYRFGKIKEFLGLAGQPSDILEKFISDYFVYDRMGLLESEAETANERLKKCLKRINSLYIAVCKPAYDIRGGKLGPNIPYTSYDGKNSVRMIISEKIDLFDLMIANAVYTLGFNGVRSITVKKIFRLLTGDENAAPEPKVYKDIYGRICKMMDTDIEFSERSDRKKTAEGKMKFLYLSRDSSQKTNSIFNYEGDPAICRYAIADGYKFINIDLRDLKILRSYEGASGEKICKKAVQDNVVNILMKLYFAWRIEMLCPDDPIIKRRKYDASKIKFGHYDSRRAGLFEISGIERKNDSLDTIRCILEHYLYLGKISGYEFETAAVNGAAEVVGVKIIPIENSGDD